MKKNEKVQSKAIGEWLYMGKKITVKELGGLFTDAGSYDVEIWEEAGVLEIGLPDGNTIDMEAVRINPKDEVTNAYVAANNVEEVFLVTFRPEIFEAAKEVMRKVIDTFGGFFCGDTEDFEPQFR